jgi:hypothetical protein
MVSFDQLAGYIYNELVRVQDAPNDNEHLAGLTRCQILSWTNHDLWSRLEEDVQATTNAEKAAVLYELMTRHDDLFYRDEQDLSSCCRQPRWKARFEEEEEPGEPEAKTSTQDGAADTAPNAAAARKAPTDAGGARKSPTNTNAGGAREATPEPDTTVCCGCRQRIHGHGHNGRPLYQGQVCDVCNEEVILHRLG